MSHLNGVIDSRVCRRCGTRFRTTVLFHGSPVSGEIYDQGEVVPEEAELEAGGHYEGHVDLYCPVCMSAHSRDVALASFECLAQFVERGDAEVYLDRQPVTPEDIRARAAAYITEHTWKEDVLIPHPAPRGVFHLIDNPKRQGTRKQWHECFESRHAACVEAALRQQGWTEGSTTWCRAWVHLDGQRRIFSEGAGDTR